MLALMLAVTMSSDGGTASPATLAPPKYESVVYLSGDLAAAIPIAAEKLLGPQARAKDCLDQLQSYRVHVSRDGDVITVVFWPNTRCGEGLKGGGGVVELDAKTLKVVRKKAYE
jgi:hypothetical protein